MAVLPTDKLLKEAADWAIRLQYEQPSEADKLAFEQWCACSPEHQAAWEKAQCVFHAFEPLSTDVGQQAVKNLTSQSSRRHSLRVLGGLLLLAPASLTAWRYLPWQSWTADASSGMGEQKTIQLADGTQVVLNTDSAIAISFNESTRRIRLIKGEILVTTHADMVPVSRPFVVDTVAGAIVALGTRFSVRQLDDDVTRVAVFEDAVEVRPLNGGVQVVQASQQMDFSVQTNFDIQPLNEASSLWTQGILLVRDWRLLDVVNELSRYRTGVLRCDPAVAELRVSGSLSLVDTDAALQALERSFPIQINRYTRYWVMVMPA